MKDSDPNQLIIHDIAIRGTVTLVDLRAEVKFNHVIDIRVDESEIQKIKKFIHQCPKVPPEESGKLRWNDTPIRPPGNVLHCVKKKSTHMEFGEVWDARGLDDPLNVGAEDRIDLEPSRIRREAQVVVEVIPEIYMTEDIFGVTLHILTIALLQETEAEMQSGRMLVLQSPKKKRRVQ